MTRNKLTTSLHLIGLSLGISVCLLIGLFIRHELSFDRYHSKADRIYRINQVWIDFGKKEFHYSTPFPFANQIRKDISGLERVTKVHHPFQTVIELNPLKRFKQDKVMFTDPEFLDVFDVEVVQGNAYETLRQPFHAILTESTAKKYYGNDDPIGKVFLFKDKFNVTVGAVVKDFPGNTHLPAELLLSLADDEDYLGTSLTHYGSVSGGSTFILLPEDNPEPTPALISGLLGIYDKVLNTQPWMDKDSRCEVEVQPLMDIHFNSKYANGGQWVQAVNKMWLWFFGGVGLAVLLLAGINFVNLSTAESLGRSKEVGVRKTIGAGKSQLISQFLLESFGLVLISAIIGVMLTKSALPYINHLVGKQIEFNILQSGGLLFYLFVGILLTSLLAGIYPAWIIAAFRPILALKSMNFQAGLPTTLLRKSLVVVQFSISISLLISLILIGKQLNFIRYKNLGFEKDNMIVVNLPNDELKGKQLLSQELSRIPGLGGYSYSTSPPGADEHWGTLMSVIGREDPDRKQVTTIMSDEYFCSLYNFKFIAGRSFVPSDTAAVSESIPEEQRFAKSIINRKAVSALGFETPEAALGKRFWAGMMGWHHEIIGVVEDFNVGSLRDEIKPTLISPYLRFCDKLNVKVSGGSDINQVINQLGSAFKIVYPKGIFEYHFLDEQIDNLYKAESRLFGLFRLFSGIAMLISCLGLWGLITFTTQQKVKEIGIRKVLGASLANIVSMLTRDFILLVFIAIAIASPLAYWGMSKWLQSFAFRVPIGITVFLWAGVSSVLIVLFTVSFQSIKGALANPVSSLRSE